MRSSILPDSKTPAISVSLSLYTIVGIYGQHGPVPDMLRFVTIHAGLLCCTGPWFQARHFKEMMASDYEFRFVQLAFSSLSVG